MSRSEYHLRRTTDFLIDSLESSDQLKSETGAFDEQFTRQLTQTLRTTPLLPTELRGAYFDLYLPAAAEGEDERVAVKITSKDKSLYSSAKERMHQLATSEELQSIVSDPSFFFLEYKQPPIQFSDLSEEEKVFAFLALEHKRYEQFYAPYVIPAVFIGYKRESDEIRDLAWPPGTEGWEYLTEVLSARGRLTSDNREVVARKGDTVFAMVQDFKELGPSVFKLSRSALNTDQRRQLLDLADKLERVFEQTGYFPDENMTQRSDNLRFTMSGALVLIDTNHLDHKDHVTGASAHYIEIVRDIANNIPVKIPQRHRQG